MADRLPGLASTDQNVTGGTDYIENEAFLKNRVHLKSILHHLCKAKSPDKGVYSYQLTRGGESTQWAIQQAWRTDPSGHREFLSTDIQKSQPTVDTSNADFPFAIKSTLEFKSQHKEFDQVIKIAKRMHSMNKLPGIESHLRIATHVSEMAFHKEIRNKKPPQFVPLIIAAQGKDGLHQYLFVQDPTKQQWRLYSAWHLAPEGKFSQIVTSEDKVEPLSAVAVVNGVAILESELKQQLSSNLHSSFSGDKPPSDLTARLGPEGRKKALNDLINTELIYQDFVERTGVIQEETLDEDVSYIIESFAGGDEETFYTELFDTGMNLGQFRHSRERRIVEAYMRRFIEKSAQSNDAPEGENKPDPKGNQPANAVNDWINDLRLKAEIEIYESH